MDYPIHIDTILNIKVWDCPFCNLKGCWSQFLYNVFLSLKIVLILANSADPAEILPYAAFYLGLHCLQTYLFAGTQNEKV